jgi:hypothetical protein
MVSVAEKVKCVKVRRPDSHGNMWCICQMKGYAIADEFDGAEVGERIELEYCEMTQEELDALPEFEGW